MSSTPPGLIDAASRVAGTAMSILQSRLELATLEIGQARRRAFSALAIGLCGVLIFAFGVLALSLCAVWLLWPRFGIGALAGMGVIYLAVGYGLLMKVRNDIRASPPLLEATHAELRRDAAMLRGGPGWSEH